MLGQHHLACHVEGEHGQLVLDVGVDECSAETPSGVECSHVKGTVDAFDLVPQLVDLVAVGEVGAQRPDCHPGKPRGKLEDPLARPDADDVVSSCSQLFGDAKADAGRGSSHECGGCHGDVLSVLSAEPVGAGVVRRPTVGGSYLTFRGPTVNDGRILRDLSMNFLPGSDPFTT